MRLHDLWHGAATLALAAGVELKMVQAMLEHASIVLTADTYASVLPQVAHKAAERTALLVLRDGAGFVGRCRRRAGRRGLLLAPPGSPWTRRQDDPLRFSPNKTVNWGFVVHPAGFEPAAFGLEGRLLSTDGYSVAYFL